MLLQLARVFYKLDPYLQFISTVLRHTVALWSANYYGGGYNMIRYSPFSMNHECEWRFEFPVIWE